MNDKEDYDYLENRDVLGQLKTHGNNKVRKNSWSIILLASVGALFLTVLVYNAAFKDKRQKTYYSNRTIKSRGDFFSFGNGIGLHTDYWEDGTIHRETNFNDQGKLDGMSRIWNRKGVLISEIDHKNGKLEGQYKRWDKYGNLIIHEVYINDKLTNKII